MTSNDELFNLIAVNTSLMNLLKCKTIRVVYLPLFQCIQLYIEKYVRLSNEN